MKFFKIPLILILFFLSISMLRAQQFEQGSGIGGCQAGSGVCNGWQWQGPQQQPSTQPSTPPVRWADRWGTLVIGGEIGKPAIFGVSSNMESKSSANALAINKCKALGGGDTCKIKATYYNQCIALAWGKTTGYAIAQGPNISETKERSLKLCGQITEGCDVIYSQCSMPVRIQ